MSKKFYIALCLVLVFSAVVPLRVNAGQGYGGEIIAPMWTHIREFNVSLRIDNGQAFMSGDVFSQPGTMSITVDAVLVRINTNNGTTTQVGAWRNLEANGSVWLWDETTTVDRGFPYRLTLTATVHRNGSSETATQSITAWAN